MYWKATQYPQLKNLSRAEQRHIIAEALKRHARWGEVRFWAVLVGAFGIVLSYIYVAAASEAPEWVAWLLPFLCGGLFFGYLLWEINGPCYRAVQVYLAHRT
ncbi:hypothetical protein [Massilia glaciei]|uniref:Uncharacterized protein n=1 Tax=Massilia glaciei TaxID=1524097 RepID=A0A2U2HJK6_9BURK|nr:hypothetical protein [Massilia glaciei]PWF47605.1 hypothetical protein C7C56_014760 [Massilia glaciei]